MIQAQRLSHATIETPDLQRSLDYFVNVNGLVEVSRDAKSAWLASKLGQLSIALVRADEPACVRMAFEIAPDLDVADVVKTLAARGISARTRDDPFPGAPPQMPPTTISPDSSGPND